MKLHSRDSIEALVGQEVGRTEWKMISQDMINQFADLTDDHQFIHVDEEAAKKTPFGKTIAHGFLTLSMLGGFVSVADIALEGAYMGFNYGFDKIRFLNPVPSNSRIRGRFVLKSVTERKPGEFLLVMEASVEVEGADKPALIADWLTLTMVSAD